MRFFPPAHIIHPLPAQQHDHGHLVFSISSTLEGTGTKPQTFWLVGNPLYLLSHSCPKRCTWLVMILRQAVTLKQALVGVKAPKVCHHQNGLLTRGEVGPWIHAAETKFGPYSSFMRLLFASRFNMFLLSII